MGQQPTRTLAEVECTVLRLSATGVATDDVADRLGIAPDEVRRHLGVAILALGASSKLEAIVLALRRGLIDLPGA